MIPALKMYKIDYEFLISNYLNKELWKKKWNLFVYKDNVFTLNLYCIYTKENCIKFEIKYNKLELYCEYIEFYLNNTTIEVLQKQINGAIFRLMECYDERLCIHTEGYQRICEMCLDEEEKLAEIANNYLDDCGVTQDDIRSAYIARYVCDNTKCDIYKTDYLNAHKYLQLTDMFIVFTKITKDENRYNVIIKTIGNTEHMRYIENQTKEFEKYFNTDDYEQEMIDNLFEI